MQDEVKTATLRKRPGKRQAANDNGFRKADALADSLVEQLKDPRVAMLADEAVKAYCYGFRFSRGLRNGSITVQTVVESVNWYMAKLDGALNLSRTQWFFLLRLVYVGAGLKPQADKADQLFRDHIFGDLPFGPPDEGTLKQV